VGQNLVKELFKNNPHHSSDSYKTYCSPSVKNSLFCKPVAQNELICIINKLKSSKSPGPNDIGPKPVKENALFFIDPLIHLFNTSICTGKVPDKLKLAKVIPVYKKGETHLPGNYRPISLLSVFDKLLEKIMYYRLYSHLQVNKVLYKYQFGFRKNYSTSLALIDVIDNIYSNINNDKFCGGVYLDLQKAFDTVNHDILLYKLYHYGVRGVAHDWFRDYLTNRQQFTSLSGINSSFAYLACGVPQGSVLGPLLFLIYVNDIGNAVPYQAVKLFADDTNLFVFGDSLADIENQASNCVCALNNWFVSNKLSLNLSKTCFMIFSPKPVSKQSLVVNAQLVELVSNCKYLGIIIDDQLKWVPHIDNIYNKIIKFSSIFYKLREKLPNKMLKDIYYTFVYPHLLNGIELYGNTKASYLDKLIKLNNKLLRILQSKPLSTPTRELYKTYNTLQLLDLHKQQLLLFVHKYVHHPEKLPEIFVADKFFIFNEEIHDYNTRNKSNMHIYYSKNSAGLRTIRHKAAVLWNELPVSLQEINSLSVFKNKLKQYLLLSY